MLKMRCMNISNYIQLHYNNCLFPYFLKLQFQTGFEDEFVSPKLEGENFTLLQNRQFKRHLFGFKIAISFIWRIKTKDQQNALRLLVDTY